MTRTMRRSRTIPLLDFGLIALSLVVGCGNDSGPSAAAGAPERGAGGGPGGATNGGPGAGGSTSSTGRSGGGGANVGGGAGAGGSAASGGAAGSNASGGSSGVMADASAAADAPAADALAADAPHPTDGPGPACAGLFCEDFESGQIDSAKWNVQTAGGATAVVEGTNVAHGRYAARFHGRGAPLGGAKTAYAYLIAKNAPASLRTHNFGRAYFYIAPRSTSVDLGMVFAGTTGFPKPTYMSIAGHSGGWQLGFIKLDGSPTGESQSQPPGAMPIMTWSCLEWEFDDAPDRVDAWADGAVIGSLDPEHVDYPPGHVPGAPIFGNMTSGLVGAFVDFGFGFYDWHPAGVDFDLYYDDIVLDTKRPGCL